MDVSIIIVSYNTCDLTLQCLNSIYKETHDVTFEIIVVDNASTDCSVDSIRSLYPSVIVIASAENLGFGRANNLGAQQAKGKYLFLLNSDTLLLDNVVYSLFEYMESLPISTKIACCGTSLLDHDKRPVISGGNFPSLLQDFSDLGFRYLYPRFYRSRLAVGKTFDGENAIEVDYISGADVFVNRMIFNRLQGFDEDYFMYYEDTDFFLRLRESGYKALILPFLHILHLEAASFKGKHSFKAIRIGLFYKSKTLYYKKHKNKVSCYVMKLFSVWGCLTRILKYRTHVTEVIRIIIRA